VTPRLPLHAALVVATLGLAPLPALPQAPTPAAEAAAVPAEVLRAQFAQTLPGAWTVTDLTVDAQANMGTAVDPDIRSRLRVIVALSAPTLAIVQREGPFTFVRPVAPAGSQRTVHARASSALRAGRWETRFEVETPEAIEVPGMPEAAIPGRIIVVGSDEERALRAEWQAQAQARHAEALAEQERAAALAAERRRAEQAAAQARQADAMAEQQRAATLAAERRRTEEADAQARRAREQAEAQARREQEEALAETRRRAAAAEAETRRQQQEADALAAVRREAAAETARVQAREAEALRAAAEAGRVAEARRAAAEVLETAARREAEAQASAQRLAVESRAAQIAELRGQFRAEDRNIRIAAVERAMRSEDPALRVLGMEAALSSGDGALLGLGLRLFFQQTREVPVSFFVPATQPQVPGRGRFQVAPATFAVAMNGLVLSIREFDVASGALTGTSRVGSDPATLTGTLARSEFTITLTPSSPRGRGGEFGGAYGLQHCTLTLRLSDVQTLDGMFACASQPYYRDEPTPVLLARISLG